MENFYILFLKSLKYVLKSGAGERSASGLVGEAQNSFSGVWRGGTPGKSINHHFSLPQGVNREEEGNSFKNNDI